MNLDPMSLTYLTRIDEPTPEARFREEFERSKKGRSEQAVELVEPEQRKAASLLRARVVVSIGRFFARPA